MSEVVIRSEGLGKKYNIRHGQSERYTALRDVITERALSLMRLRQPVVKRSNPEEFWALKAIQFEVRRGEVVGVIGRNGAGKSTLLKILSRITEPTEGRVELRGRTASLLEVGTGFHPELSGRENIFLNGAMLGMSRLEIKRKFDEIVEFSEVKRFLDTPVKRYSSGMYVRLAFAVAAHLEPEILIVDEVLAVGDAEFQKKSLGKMQDAARGEGRTVLFVSHNMSAIRALCQRAIVLHRGQLSFTGGIDAALSHFAGLSERRPEEITTSEPSRPTILRVEVSETDACAGHLKLEVEFTSRTPMEPVLIGAVFYTRLGVPIFGLNTWQSRTQASVRARKGIATLYIPNLQLHSGVYNISVFLGEGDQNYDVRENAAYFNFMSPEPLPPTLNCEFIGPMRVEGLWNIEVLE